MKDRILELLRQESGYLSGQEMSTLKASPVQQVESGGGSAERRGTPLTPLPTGGYHLDAPPAVFPPGKLLPGWTATLGRSWCRF